MDSEDPDWVYRVDCLEQEAEILVDQWGVPHIYAKSERDVFVAQGFNAARDRLFQIDLWRRKGLGLLSEVFGPKYLDVDRASRLFLYRGDMRSEWLSYGSQTKEVTSAFVEGINAYVELCHKSEQYLPPEFKAFEYMPGLWSPVDVARIRSHGLHYNLEQEVGRAVTIARYGSDVENLRRVREPECELEIPEGLDLSLVSDRVLDVYRLATTMPAIADPLGSPDTERPVSRCMLDGSNNWVVAGSRTSTGRPILANDPHRAVSVPSLRYISHLSAPGLDVIGGGEPSLPGISIGHNGKVAFGLTIFPIDQEDLYVYRTDPNDQSRYWYQGHWEPMKTVLEEVPVRGAGSETVELRFTRHGPVIHDEPSRNAAFAVRAAWLEPGMAPYLGSMEYMNSSNASDFVRAMNRWGSPGENQVYADKNGVIGWKPGGLVPKRPNWSGALPVPGDGEYEWAGYLDADELPGVADPQQGWFATANEMNLPRSYREQQDVPISYDWYPPYRKQRIAEVLSRADRLTIDDCVELQADFVSVPARTIVSALKSVETKGADWRVEAAMERLCSWNGEETPESWAAAVFEVWYRRHLRPALLGRGLDGLVDDREKSDVIDLLTPIEELAADARVDLKLLETMTGRPEELSQLMSESLRSALDELHGLLGGDMDRWSWGRLHRAAPMHPFSDLNVEVLRSSGSLRMGSVPRGGSGDTVGNTAYGGDFRQMGGSTFRVVIDVGAWDESVAMNSPGQSGWPNSTHYADLFPKWGRNEAFPLLYSRERIEAHASQRILLRRGESAS